MNSKFYISDKINSITFFHGERRVDTEITDRYLPIMVIIVVVAVFTSIVGFRFSLLALAII